MTDFFVIFADGSVDQVTQGKRNMQREVRDLKEMGCAVKTIGPVSGPIADDIESAAGNGVSFANLQRMAKGE